MTTDACVFRAHAVKFETFDCQLTHRQHYYYKMIACEHFGAAGKWKWK